MTDVIVKTTCKCGKEFWITEEEAEKVYDTGDPALCKECEKEGSMSETFVKPCSNCQYQSSDCKLRMGLYREFGEEWKCDYFKWKEVSNVKPV